MTGRRSGPKTLALLTALAAPGCLGAQPPSVKPRVPAVALATGGLAGQSVAVLPLTMILADSRIPGTTGTAARTVLLRWADSLLGETLGERAPEVSWVLPAVLRVRAKGAGGLLPTPDQMGQAVMRSPNLKDVPDPLRSYVRQLLGLAGGGRYALIPAAISLLPAGISGDSLEVQLAAVLSDGRLGRVVWRTLAVGRGENADQAYRAALATLFPPESGSP